MEDLYNKASLVLTPQMVETGKVYSMKPEDRKGDFTFSRSTYATRVGPTGLVEKETQNLLLQSNSFDTTWSATNSNVTGGQSGYDGTNDAWLLSKSAGYGRIDQSYTFSGLYSFSLYAKANTLNWISIGANASTFSSGCFFDLANGVVGSSGSSVVHKSIESVGNGWYRCIAILNNPTENFFRIYPADGDNNVTGTSGSIYIQDAQLEQGLVARDYIETTTAAVYGGITDNVPRLDYTDSSCPALLLEPQRTNDVEHSEYINSGGGWSYTGGLTTEVNSISSPEGVTNGTKVVIGSNQYGELRSPSISQSAATYAISVFAKTGDLDWFIFQYNDSTVSNYVRVWFNLSTGAVGSNVQVGWTIVGTPTIEDYGSGWYRCNIVLTTTASSTNRMVMFGATGDSAFGATENSYFYAYGAQVEQGSYATSYIPTYGSAVTRNGDDMYGISSIYGGDAQTIFLDLNYDDYDTSNFWTSLQIGTGLNDWFFFGKYQNSIRTYIKSNNTIVYDNTYFVGFNEPQRLKILLKYDSSGAKTFLNGQLIINQTYLGSITIPEFDRLTIQRNYGQPTLIKTQVNQVLVFPTALTDQEAIDLTTI